MAFIYIISRFCQILLIWYMDYLFWLVSFFWLDFIPATKIPSSL